VTLRFNPAPGWPQQPAGWTPPPGWQPDPGWPPAPAGWQFWVGDAQPSLAGDGTGAYGNPYGGGSYGNPYGGSTFGNPYAAGTNGQAIASLVLGILGFLTITAVLGIIFGIVALVRIGQVPQKGKRLAIAGLVLSVLWLAGLTSAIAYNAASQAHRSASSGQITQPGSMNIFSLRVGDCFNNPGSGGVTTVTAIPCDQAHNAQVFAEFNAANSTSYPGSSALRQEATNGCNSRVAGSVNKAKVTDSMSIRFLYPLAGSWAIGHRGISCLLVNSTADLRSSLLTGSSG
jgi:Domain of unknown function (DUF4190)/Septum formation